MKPDHSITDPLAALRKIHNWIVGRELELEESEEHAPNGATLLGYQAQLNTLISVREVIHKAIEEIEGR